MREHPKQVQATEEKESLPSSQRSDPSSQGSTASEDPHDSDSDLSQGPQEPTSCQLQLKSDRSVLKQFIQQIGIPNFHFPNNWQSLSPATRQKRTSKMRQLLTKVIDTVSPDGSEEMKAHLLKSYKSEVWMDGAEGPKISALLNTIVDAYRAAET